MAKSKKIIAEELAKGQREISVSQFFQKNKHLLGFDNPIKALLTSVKEGVDNALDACEEADILPDILVQVKEVGTNRFKLVVEDNGPGIVEKQMGFIFGKLLYGSKFQIFGGKQGRGQQGIGISAAVLYAQETTGKPARIISKIDPEKQAQVIELKIDVTKNEPVFLSKTSIDWKKETGTRVEIELEAKYIEKRASVLEYIKETAVVNPHASFTYIDPKGKKQSFKRVTKDLPKKPERIKPHPYGMELGSMNRLLKATNSRTLKSFLTTEFDKVGSGTADEILKISGLDPKISPKLITLQQADKMLKAMHGAKIMAPSTTCLSPIGADVLKKSLEAEYALDFAYAVTRPASVYKGNPFLIEAAVGYGGEISSEGAVRLIRFANKVPLLYQQGACAITKATSATSWKSYGLGQSGRNLPTGPAIILVHVASVWAPFTSESKEAIAHIPEIIKETKLALQECGRHLQLFIGKRQKRELARKKKEMFKNYSEELAISLSDLTAKDKKAIEKKLLKIAEHMLKTGEIIEEEEIETTKITKRKIGAFKSSDEDEE